MQRRRSDFPGGGQITRREFLGDAAVLAASLPAISELSLWQAPTAGAQEAIQANIQGKDVTLANSVISVTWEITPAGLQMMRAENRRNGQAIGGPRPVFELHLRSGDEIVSFAMRVIGEPHVEELRATSGAARFSERVDGRAIVASFQDKENCVKATWRAILRSGSHYIRQQLSFEPLHGDLPIARIVLLDMEVPGAAVTGGVKGSPITASEWFFAFEHPLSDSRVENGRVLCSLERQLPLGPGRTVAYSSVIGVTEPKQLRRGFLRYVERERAHPYRTFLHYNSWYDLGYFTPYNEAAAVDAIDAFGDELHVKRGLTLDSFLFDDGWDNHKSLWEFNSGFPNGFTPIRAAAEKYGAAPGIWLSPWGGYDKPREERLAYGKLHGYEEGKDGFVLSGPRYYERFHEVCEEMIRRYGVNQFKFDGTADTSTVYPGSKFDSDFDAMISLIGDLREEKPDLYVNLTSGTYPSPFWLRYADSTWRGGEDHSFAGVGSYRQQWITYRDAATYKHVVQRGPLYPLNSLMLHGLIYARSAEHLMDDPQHDFKDEVRAYFGSGTQLQEMYITHSLLSEADWDALAASAQWSRRNADILVDTHWIGGDPERLEVYGWGAWSERGGIFTLRNPNKVAQVYDLDVQTALELPAGAVESFVARDPWADKTSNEFELRAGQPHTITLQPFQVLTLEANPQ